MESVLLIESAPRETGEKAVLDLYARGVGRLDILTCFPEAPDAFDHSRGKVLSVHSEQARGKRSAFVQGLCGGQYTSVVILWTGSAILRNWSLAVAARTSKRLQVMDRDLILVPVRLRYAKALAAAFVKPLTPDINTDALDPLITRALEVMLAPFLLGYLCLFTVHAHLRRSLLLAFRR